MLVLKVTAESTSYKDAIEEAIKVAFALGLAVEIEGYGGEAPLKVYPDDTYKQAADRHQEGRVKCNKCQGTGKVFG